MKTVISFKDDTELSNFLLLSLLDWLIFPTGCFNHKKKAPTRQEQCLHEL